MSIASDVALLFTRDLKRLSEELAAFPTEASVWATLPGISNSAGHMVLHLEGNLREFIGRLLGGLDYKRDRPQEFAGPAVPQADLLARIAWLTENIPAIVGSLTALDADYPQLETFLPASMGGALLHIEGHLQWHLGQIDYLRRVLTGAGAIVLASI